MKYELHPKQKTRREARKDENSTSMQKSLGSGMNSKVDIDPNRRREMSKRGTSAEPDVRTAQEEFMRNIDLATKVYYSAALGEAIRDANGRKLRQENDRHDADVRGERRNAGMCLPGPRDGPGFAGPGLTQLRNFGHLTNKQREVLWRTKTSR